MKDNKVVGSCECCGNYVYDEENEYYVCEVDLDEDDMVRFLKGDVRACPYYQSDDEYKIVRQTDIVVIKRRQSMALDKVRRKTIE